MYVSHVSPKKEGGGGLSLTGARLVGVGGKIEDEVVRVVGEEVFDSVHGRRGRYQLLHEVAVLDRGAGGDQRSGIGP